MFKNRRLKGIAKYNSKALTKRVLFGGRINVELVTELKLTNVSKLINIDCFIASKILLNCNIQYTARRQLPLISFFIFIFLWGVS